MAITNEQLMLLDNLIYLDEMTKKTDEGKDSTVKEIINRMFEKSEEEFKEAVTDKQFYYCEDMVNGMDVDQWKTVLNAIAEDETLMNMKITNICDENDYTEGKDKDLTGFRAACFTIGNETAVIFRGTVGSYQWDDNGNGGTNSDLTNSQSQAYMYLRNLQYGDLSENKIYVSGHSKGGNMAQIAGIIAMTRTDLDIERCLSFNGQGYSKGCIEYLRDIGIINDEALDKIYTISSSRDLVNSLFIPLAKPENIIYLISNSQITNPFDYLLQGHIGSDVFDKNGNLHSEVIGPSDIQLMIGDFCIYVADNYSLEDQDDIYSKLMSLLADNNNMGSLFLDIFCMDDSSCARIGFPDEMIENSEITPLVSAFIDYALSSVEKLTNVCDAIKCYLTDFVLSKDNIERIVELDRVIKDFYGRIFEKYSEIFNNNSEMRDIIYTWLTNPVITLLEYEDVDTSAGLFDDSVQIDDVNELLLRLGTIKSEFDRAETRGRPSGYNVIDPLIIDLGKDGFDIEKLENGTHFDLDSNGFAERMNWTTKDGFLALDLNGNGVIDNGGELFGDRTLLADGSYAPGGFAALSQYDLNSDGVIDANDEVFSRLKVWTDKNGDGISSDDEVTTLGETGINSIDLNCTEVNAETGTEALLGRKGLIRYTDGTTGEAAELWAAALLYDTEDKLDIGASSENSVKGIGNIHDLNNALALDKT